MLISGHFSAGFLQEAGLELGQRRTFFRLGRGLDDHTEEDSGGSKCEMSPRVQAPHFYSLCLFLLFSLLPTPRLPAPLLPSPHPKLLPQMFLIHLFMLMYQRPIRLNVYAMLNRRVTVTMARFRGLWRGLSLCAKILIPLRGWEGQGSISHQGRDFDKLCSLFQV